MTTNVVVDPGKKNDKLTAATVMKYNIIVLV